MKTDTEVRAHTHVMVSMGRQAIVTESVAGRKGGRRLRPRMEGLAC